MVLQIRNTGKCFKASSDIWTFPWKYIWSRKHCRVLYNMWSENNKHIG